MHAGVMQRGLVLALVIAASAPASADTDYFAKPNQSSAVMVRHQKSRTLGEKLTIGGLLVGAAITGGLGLHWHLASRDAANAVSASHDRIVGVWTDDKQTTYDRAGSAGTEAIVGYSLAGACIAGAIVAAVLTSPGYENTPMAPALAITRGGAVVGGSVHF